MHMELIGSLKVDVAPRMKSCDWEAVENVRAISVFNISQAEQVIRFWLKKNFCFH